MKIELSQFKNHPEQAAGATTLDQTTALINSGDLSYRGHVCYYRCAHGYCCPNPSKPRPSRSGCHI